MRAVFNRERIRWLKRHGGNVTLLSPIQFVGVGRTSVHLQFIFGLLICTDLENELRNFSGIFFSFGRAQDSKHRNNNDSCFCIMTNCDQTLDSGGRADSSSFCGSRSTFRSIHCFNCNETCVIFCRSHFETTGHSFDLQCFGPSATFFECFYDFDNGHNSCRFNSRRSDNSTCHKHARTVQETICKQATHCETWTFRFSNLNFISST